MKVSGKQAGKAVLFELVSKFEKSGYLGLNQPKRKKFYKTRN